MTGSGGRHGGNRLDRALADHPPGLWPFIPAGYPNLDVTAELMRRLGRSPIRGIEVGLPFSDPIADGPVIQRAFSHALSAGLRVGRVFDMVSELRGELGVPILAMVSVSIVVRLGMERFVEDARSAGFDGMIVPDISLEEAPTLARIVRAADLRMPMLVAPTSPPGRRRRIAKVASGFLYYVSVQGTTGERSALPSNLRDNVEGLRSATGCPTLVGFGIKDRAGVRELCSFADGAIVGSAVVRRLTAAHEAGGSPEAIVESAARFVAQLLED